MTTPLVLLLSAAPLKIIVVVRQTTFAITLGLVVVGIVVHFVGFLAGDFRAMVERALPQLRRPAALARRIEARATHLVWGPGASRRATAAFVLHIGLLAAADLFSYPYSFDPLPPSPWFPACSDEMVTDMLASAAVSIAAVVVVNRCEQIRSHSAAQATATASRHSSNEPPRETSSLSASTVDGAMHWIFGTLIWNFLAWLFRCGDISQDQVKPPRRAVCRPAGPGLAKQAAVAAGSSRIVRGGCGTVRPAIGYLWSVDAFLNQHDMYASPKMCA